MLTNGSPSEEETVRDDLQSFEELFKLYHRKVFAVCLRMTRNPSEAEDLTQDVFVQVFRKLKTFRGDSAFTTWLYRLTVNQVLMHFRKTKQRKEELTEEGEMPEQKVNGQTAFSGSPILDRLALDEAIVKLAPGYRAVFVLHDIEGLQHLEIAAILGCSVGTCKSQLHKARLKIRRLLMQPVHSQEGAMSQRIDVDESLQPRLPAILPSLNCGALSPL